MRVEPARSREIFWSERGREICENGFVSDIVSPRAPAPVNLFFRKGGAKRGNSHQPPPPPEFLWSGRRRNEKEFVTIVFARLRAFVLSR